MRRAWRGERAVKDRCEGSPGAERRGLAEEAVVKRRDRRCRIRTGSVMEEISVVDEGFRRWPEFTSVTTSRDADRRVQEFL
jgi:hypothetical protein